MNCATTVAALFTKFTKLAYQFEDDVPYTGYILMVHIFRSIRNTEKTQRSGIQHK